MIFNNFANKCLNLATAKEDKIYGSGMCYLGLCTDQPTADGNTLNEISSETYPIIIFDAKTDGNPLVGDVLRDPDGATDDTTDLYPEKKLTVTYRKVVVFRAGALQLTFK